MNTKPLYLSFAVATMISQMAHAHQSNLPADAKPVHTNLDPIIIRLVVPTNVEVLDKAKLKESATQNIEDMAMYEPEVGVRSDNLQMGHQNFSIRGIEGNRILMTIDGIPLPDAQRDLSPPGVEPDEIGRDTVETDTIKSVQINKGANGTAQGDGAVGGSVNMRTLSPSDILQGDKAVNFGLKHSYRSTYNSHGTTASVAAKSGAFSTLLVGTVRHQEEAENYPIQNDPVTGTHRTESNNQEISQKNVLLKANYHGNNHQLESTFEQFHRQVDTQRLDKTGSGPNRRTGNTEQKAETAFDEHVRRRVALDYAYLPTQGVVERFAVKLYDQKLDTKTDNDTSGTITPPTGASVQRHIQSYGIYRQSVRGVRPEIYASIDTNHAKHNLLFGAEYRQTKTERFKDTFTSVNGAAPTQARSAYFPPTDRKVASVYVQDNIAFNNGAAVGLGLRFEQENSKFDFNNPYYLTSNKNDPLAFKDLKNSVFLPSLGLSYPITKNLTGSLSYRRGYRSPDVNFVASGYKNSGIGFSYQIIPNPKLKPETSDNVELGLKFNGDKFKASGSVFYSRYKDFVNTVQNVISTRPFVFEMYYDNINKARAYGAEIKASYQLSDHLKASGAVAWIDSKNKSTDEPLSTAYPVNGVLGLDYVADTWDVGAKLRLADKNKDVPTDGRGNKYFQAPGYGVLDLTANYRPVAGVEFGIGVYNVLDKQYWQAADTKGVADNNLKYRYTQPGRNFAVSAELKF